MLRNKGHFCLEIKKLKWVLLVVFSCQLATVAKACDAAFVTAQYQELLDRNPTENSHEDDIGYWCNVAANSLNGDFQVTIGILSSLEFTADHTQFGGYCASPGTGNTNLFPYLLAYYVDVMLRPISQVSSGEIYYWCGQPQPIQDLAYAIYNSAEYKANNPTEIYYAGFPNNGSGYMVVSSDPSKFYTPYLQFADYIKIVLLKNHTPGTSAIYNKNGVLTKSVYGQPIGYLYAVDPFSSVPVSSAPFEYDFGIYFQGVTNYQLEKLTSYDTEFLGYSLYVVLVGGPSLETVYQAFVNP